MAKLYRKRPKNLFRGTNFKWCSRCGHYRHVSKFWKDPSRDSGLEAYCRTCKHASTDKYKKNEANRNYYRRTVQKSYEWRLKRKFGLSIEQYFAMLDAQGGGCAICGGVFIRRGGVMPLCVDHDAATGKIRGLLCAKCNMAIGQFKDDSALLMKAIEYLNREAPTIQ